MQVSKYNNFENFREVESSGIFSSTVGIDESMKTQTRLAYSSFVPDVSFSVAMGGVAVSTVVFSG